MPDTRMISVIIPTVGRESLGAALESVRTQSLPAAEVIVVYDGSDESYAETLGKQLTGLGRVVATGGALGVAAARNLGMRDASGTYIAFLDDDDTWLPFHLETAVSYLEQHPDVDVVATRALLRGDASDRLMPREVFRRGSLLNFMYGRDSWRARERRISTPTLVFRRDLATLPMDEDLPMMEDIWWLLMAEDRGHSIRQIDDVSVVVNHASERNDARWASEGGDIWLSRLRTHSEDAYVNYVIGTHVRTAARRGDMAQAKRLVDRLKTSSHVSIGQRILIAGFLSLAATVRGLSFAAERL